MNSILSRIPRIRTRTLPVLITACGALGLIFRLLITITGLDDKGLMIPWHFSWVCLWLVTIAAAVILVLGVLPIRGPAAYRANSPGSIVGCGLAAGTALATAVGHFRTGAGPAHNLLAPVLFWIQGGLLLLAAAAFVLVGICRLLGKKPYFLLHGLICVFFALQMVTLYRNWSFDPQLHEYCFQLFASIALTMMAYQLACFDMGRGSHRKLWAWGLAAVYFCCLSAASGLFFIAEGVWAFTNLSNLRRPRQRRPAEAEVPVNNE